MTDPRPADVSDITGPGASPAFRDYVHDQLQQVRTTADHGALLQRHAKARVAAASAALHAAGKPALGQAGSAGAALDQYHTVARMLDERAFYPPHDQRTESPAYAKVHHQIVVTDDKRCLVCGVKHSTLGDPAQNPFGAIQIETHHHVIEWALANAVDAAKFNQHIRPGLLRAAGSRSATDSHGEPLAAIYLEFDKDYAANMPLARIKEWVDHAADNLWPLCDIHHRHKYVGIHAITYPIWGPQDVVDQTSVEQQIKDAKGASAV